MKSRVRPPLAVATEIRRKKCLTGHNGLQLLAASQLSARLRVALILTYAYRPAINEIFCRENQKTMPVLQPYQQGPLLFVRPKLCHNDRLPRRDFGLWQ